MNLACSHEYWVLIIIRKLTKSIIFQRGGHQPDFGWILDGVPTKRWILSATSTGRRPKIREFSWCEGRCPKVGVAIQLSSIYRLGYEINWNQPCSYWGAGHDYGKSHIQKWSSNMSCYGEWLVNRTTGVWPSDMCYGECSYPSQVVPTHRMDRSCSIIFPAMQWYNFTKHSGTMLGLPSSIRS